MSNKIFLFDAVIQGVELDFLVDDVSNAVQQDFPDKMFDFFMISFAE